MNIAVLRRRRIADRLRRAALRLLTPWRHAPRERCHGG